MSVKKDDSILVKMLREYARKNRLFISDDPSFERDVLITVIGDAEKLHLIEARQEVTKEDHKEVVSVLRSIITELLDHNAR